MSPILLLAPLGVALLVLMIWALGGRGGAAFADEAAALERLRQDYFDYEAADCLLDQAEGMTALFTAKNGYEGQIALVTNMGDDFVTRMMGPGDVRNLALDSAQLTFRVNEFTGRRVAITAAPEQAKKWYARLRELEA